MVNIGRIPKATYGSEIAHKGMPKGPANESRLKAGRNEQAPGLVR
jgi:hypothetical protein